ncbi:MAG: CRISPR-associated ring nuclease Csm6 [Halothiobacillus sp.]|nr:CRISPR-associated ring nuclease Csm6 [Halothiobacillus sp.]
MNQPKTDRRILLCATGMSPQVVTETLYALAVSPSHGKEPWVPTEVHIISTSHGAEQARLNLLSEHPGWFHKLCKDYSLPPIRFTPETIHCIQNSDGRDLDDIRTPTDNESAANSIAELVRSLTQDKHSTLHVSLAGGRKTMGYYTGYALSLYGRPQDRLSHILVNGAYENHPEFYYPTPYEEIIYTRGDKPQALNCADAVIDLAESPFVRLRDGMPDRLLEGKANFTETVELTNMAQGPATMRINKNKSSRSVHVNGIPVRLTDTPFALMCWFATRALTENPEIQWTEYSEFLDLVTEL